MTTANSIRVSDNIETINREVYHARKYGNCQSAEEVHQLLTGVVKSMAESDNHEERQALLTTFLLNLPEVTLLEIGLE